MRRRGLLTFDEAEVHASKLLIAVIQTKKADPDAPAFVKAMVEDSDYIGIWNKGYFPKLETALDCTTRLEQALGLRRLVLECLECVAEGIRTLYESDDPWKARPEADRAIIGKQLQPNLSPEEFVAFEWGRSTLDDLSQRVTVVIAEEQYGDKGSENYAAAYELMSQTFWRRRCESILCEARGEDFPARNQLEFLEVALPTARQRIIAGHNYVLDEELRALVSQE